MAAPQMALGRIFSRQLIDDGLRIESRCNFCGAVIIGSASENLPKDEQQHLKDCPKIPRCQTRQSVEIETAPLPANWVA